MTSLTDRSRALAGRFMPEFFSAINTITEIVQWFLDCIAVNVFALTRSHFGERFMTFVHWAIGAAVFSTFMVFATAVSAPATLLWRLLWGPTVLGLFMYHRWVIWNKNRAGTPWHSRSHGISHLRKIPFVRDAITDEVVDKWLEPALLLLFAWIMSRMDVPLGAYLALAAVALCLRAQLYYNAQRERYLDWRDEQIEHRYRQAAIEGRPVLETGGFTMPTWYRQVIQNPPGVSPAVEDDLFGTSTPSHRITTA